MVRKQSRILMLVLVLITIFILQSPHVTANAGKETLEYEGDHYFVEVTCDSEANIPKDSYLKVEELMEGSKEYNTHFQQTKEFVSEDSEKQLLQARFFDVSIMNGENEIEPDESVRVSIQYEDTIHKKETDSLSVVHFVEDGSKELLEVIEETTNKDEITEVIFEQDSFSVIGVIVFDSIDTTVKGADSERINEAEEIHVEKEWSDGTDAHKEDAVEVTLYDIAEEKECEVLILNEENEWKGKFENLDKNKSYTIRETDVLSGNHEKAVSYKSTITIEDVKRWCPVQENKLEDGQQIILMYGESQKNLLRKSSVYAQMYLRIKTIRTKVHDVYGEYCLSDITNQYIWRVIWNEQYQAWEFYNEYGEAYLSLIYNDTSKCYEWTTLRDKAEGSYLTYENGVISAKVDGVTKYLGNITSQGPYEGLDREDVNVEQFQIYTYKIFEPVTCHIFNEKNQEIEEEVKANVITSKQIDYLGDGIDNPETNVEESRISQKSLKDLYRLSLGMNMQTDQTGMDLVMVIDVSSSMQENRDAKDANGNPILRSEALRQALNQFVPTFLSEHTKNNLSIVAFENHSIILQEWTKNPDEILEKINFESGDKFPLYNGVGTNYEAALMRTHEALSSCGKTGNAKAVLFLSDGYPTSYINGNDDVEKGNVSVYLGEASLAEEGIEAQLPSELSVAWNSAKTQSATNEAVQSFKNKNPDIMVGTIAFHTVLTDSIKNLASTPEFVTHIENGTPDDLLNAMELITEFGPTKIVVLDELSDNVDIYKEHPDFRVIARTKEGNETVLFSTKNGLTEEGRIMLDNQEPVIYQDRVVQMKFNENYQVKNDVTYYLSFNVTASQKAFNKYADMQGNYDEKGDEDTDYEGNETSSQKDGFYSNGENTKVQYTMRGVKYERKYRRPVIQVRDGRLSVVKTDLNGNRLGSGVKFILYRRADEGESDTVSFHDMEGEFVEAARGTTDKNGEIIFEHLRISVFDTGYFYYLKEEETLPGYTQCLPIAFTLYEDKVELPEEYELVQTGQKEMEDGTKIGQITVKNREKIEFSFTKVAADDYEDEISGAKFRLEILICEDKTHEHGESCWEILEEKQSTPRVVFISLSSANTYRLIETQASEGCYCPEGFWTIQTGNSKEIIIQASEDMPKLKKLSNGEYILENERVMTVPVTGGCGKDIYYMIGIILLTGGLILWQRKKLFQNLL